MEGSKPLNTQKKGFYFREDEVWRGHVGIGFRLSEVRTKAPENPYMKPIFEHKSSVSDLYIERKNEPCF